MQDKIPKSVASRGLWKGLHPGMGIASKGMIAAFVVFTALFVDFANSIYSAVREWIEHALNWYYMSALVVMLFACFYLMFSRFGRIKLGDDDSKPEFSTFSWFAMLFSAGVGHRAAVLQHRRTVVLFRQHHALGLSEQSVRGPGWCQRDERGPRGSRHACHLLPLGISTAGRST